MTLNDQQRILLDLLAVARRDVLAGRPAQRTGYALTRAIEAAHFTDMDDGTADDQAWRATRGAGVGVGQQ